MSNFVKIVCAFAAVYLAWHCIIFTANADYRNRLSDPDYLTGKTTKTYYSTQLF